MALIELRVPDAPCCRLKLRRYSVKNNDSLRTAFVVGGAVTTRPARGLQ